MLLTQDIGIFIFQDDTTTTLSARVTFKLPCENPPAILSPDTTGNSSIIGFSNPFYASISPQIFALATATVISYILVILIFITPRTFYVGGPGGGARFLGRRGVIPSSYGSSSIVGIGRRPLLQKIATVTVAISLTIATADTFNVAERQYNQGYIDSSQLVDNVVDSLEIRIIRVISDTFLWLAQVQTLIRLFPRHKEKVTIKWLGFAMVSSDTVFSILNSFVNTGPRTRPRSFSDAIPALDYLFELAISLIYASCVVYYCLSKRRFAFWHPKMKNICLVALLSLISVMIPVVFFILDIAQPDLAGWGDYIRWVGAAAASVVVWEWVERIESLERDERKDGILGREIFDGDEMLNMTPSEDASWRGTGPRSDHDGSIAKGVGDTMMSQYRLFRVRLPLRKRRRRPPPDGIATGADAMDTVGQPVRDPHAPAPQHIVVPPSRSDTGSATSTVYAVRYHNLTSPSPPQPEVPSSREEPVSAEGPKASDESGFSQDNEDKDIMVQSMTRTTTGSQGRNLWHAVQNPFKRRRSEPPAEVADAQKASGIRRSPIDRTLTIRDRIGAFASAQKERLSSRGNVPAAALPVTIIPAPKGNQRTWSPADIEGGPGEEDTTGATNMDPSRSQHESVVIIPAPTNGRTWSPEDAANSPPGSAVQRPDAAALRHQAPPPQPIFTPRGSLTISESERRPSRLGDTSYAPSPRPGTYTRPRAITPIAEDTRSETGSEVVVPRTPTTATTSTAVAPVPSETVDSEASPVDDPPASIAAVRPLSPNEPTTPVTHERGQTLPETPTPIPDSDGRDTGGTRSSPA